jgi:hypothetical protein
MKYISLILILSFITVISSFTSCCCNREGLSDPNGHVWKPFCKKDTSAPPPPAPAPPTTFHPPAPPPHDPWNIDQHIADILNPIMGHGEFNTPLPSENAIFIKRQNTNITLNPAPAPKQ